MKLKNKKILIKTTVLLFLLFLVFIGKVTLEYFEFQKVAEATSMMPAQDGGSVTVYQPVCATSPPDGVCKNCTMCGPKLGNYVCAGFSEIQVSAQGGTTEICPAQGFVYSGGGVMPTVGGGIIYGGASNLLPWVIGVPGPAVTKTQKIINFFKYHIVGSKD